MTQYSEFTLAAIQAAPVLFDREAATDKACSLIARAAQRGATLAAFSETWLPGYPFFVINRPSPLSWKAAAEYVANAVPVPGPETDRLCVAARRAEIDVGREGVILGRHRKLKPTFVERTAWGEGDASGLRVYERPYGRISGLNCWEHQMVLPGYSLIAQGTQIHIAAWPGSEPPSAPPAPVSVWARQHLLSRAFASQGACYVISAAGILRRANVPERYRELLAQEMTGNSCIIDPRGEIIAGPANPSEEEILIAENCSMEAVMAAKMACDAAGHYSRPDLFRLSVSGREIYPNRAATATSDATLEGCSDNRLVAEETFDPDGVFANRPTE